MSACEHCGGAGWLRHLATGAFARAYHDVMGGEGDVVCPCICNRGHIVRQPRPERVPVCCEGKVVPS